MAAILAAALVGSSSSCRSSRVPDPIPSPVVSIAASATKIPAPLPSARPRRRPLPARAGRAAAALGTRHGGELVSMSWYAENVDPSVLACAAAYRWRLGTHLRLRNPANGLSARVLLNDRGAFEVLGRSLDCRPAVWKALGYPLGAGVVKVQVQAA